MTTQTQTHSTLNPLSQTVRAASIYLRDRPSLCANPESLLELCTAMVKLFEPETPEACEDLGEIAARECARPTH